MFLAGIQRFKALGKRFSTVGGYVVVVLANDVLRNVHEITSLFCIPASARLRPFLNHKSSK